MSAAPTPTADPWKALGFVPADHPAWPLPGVEEMRRHMAERPGEFCEWLIERQQKIAMSEKDPLRHGFEPEIWGLVDDLLCAGKQITIINPTDRAPIELTGRSEVHISGGNGSSKSEYGARTIVKNMMAVRGVRAWCFHETGPASKARQQPRVYKFIPPEIKALKKHPVAYLKFSQANGFTGEPPTFVFPNRSQCWFMNYAMDINTIEGDEIDLVWMTELVPWEFIEATRYRMGRKKGGSRGKLILDFTPADGYTPTVAMLTEGARDVVRVPALELPLAGPLPGKPCAQAPDGRWCETVPRVREAGKANPDLFVVHFHIEDNPFAEKANLIRKAKAGGRKKILERVYGVAEKLAANQFPTFDPGTEQSAGVHVIRDAAWRRMRPQCGPAKHYLDPCSGRNYAQFWAARNPNQQIVVYREWPCPGVPVRGVGDPGCWAEFDAKLADGRKGDAQKPWGFGIERQMAEMLLAEGWTEEEIEKAKERKNARVRPVRTAQGERAAVQVDWVYERMMDSRFGNTPTATHSEMKTLIELFADLGMDFEPTPGEHQKEGIEAIQDLLYYDAEKPVGPENQPKLLIHEGCRNIIWAVTNWTGADGLHGACKDWIDLLRYMALSPPEYFTEQDLKPRGGGAY